jgi:hypothetical protein
VSRIARVCKEDTGVQYDDLEYMGSANHIWQTFVKSRIYCVNKITDKTFGEQTFTYNRVGRYRDGQNFGKEGKKESRKIYSLGIICYNKQNSHK